jgi:HD-like signal output (HDOD) protein
MPSAATVEKISAAVSIPSFPSIVARLTVLLESPESGVQEISAEIHRDPPLAAKVLRVVNSALHSPEEQILSLDRAAVVLGMAALRQIVLRVEVMRQFEHLQDSEQFSIEGLWRHSILTAELCQHLARHSARKPDVSPTGLYTCGLLHDLGRLVLLESQRACYLEVLRESRTAGVPSMTLEAERFSFNHAQVGGVVAYMWNLPGPVQSAIEYHHGPRSRIESTPSVALVSLCDYVARQIEDGVANAPQDLMEHPACGLSGIGLRDLGNLTEFGQARFERIEL